MSSEYPYLVKAEASASSNQTIRKIISGFGPIPGFVARPDFHCTLAFVRDWTSQPVLGGICATYGVKSVELFGREGASKGPLVLTLTGSHIFAERNRLLVETMGGKEDYPYSPHLTLGFVDASVADQGLAERFMEAFCDLEITFDREVGKIFRP